MSYSVLLATNLLFVGISFMESKIITKQTSSKIILYERIELIKPDKAEELKADLEERTGLKIIYTEVGHIDFLRDVAYLKVTYSLEGGIPNTIDSLTKLSQFV